MRKLLLTLLAGLAACCVATMSAFAQVYPSQAIRIVAPFGAGGGGDTTIRLLGTQLSQAVGQAVIVDNRPGANGVLGAEEVKRAPADGYTLFYGSTTSLAANASLLKKMPYDPVRDFAPVTRIGTLPFVLVVHPSVPATSVAEFIAWAKLNPEKGSFASSNLTARLSGEILNRMGGIKLLHVPYKSTTAGLVDVLSGRVPIMFLDLPPAIEHLKAGKLRALGVTTGARTALLPQVPTIAEAGLTGFEVIGWTALAVPAGTSPATVARLNAEVVKILARPDMIDAFGRVGVEVGTSSPEAMGAFIASEIQKWAQMVKAAGIEAE